MDLVLVLDMSGSMGPYAGDLITFANTVLDEFEFGAEFTAEVQTLLEARNITHRVKMDKHDPNSLSVSDRVIQNLKLRYAESLAEQPGEWADRTAQIVREYNSTEHEALHGEPPDDVMDSELAAFMLLQDNSRKLKHDSPK